MYRTHLGSVREVAAITPPRSSTILTNGEADAVLIGRELLRNASWARQAARALGGEVRVPEQYHRSV